MRSFVEVMKSCTQDGKTGTIVPAKVKALTMHQEKEMVVMTLTKNGRQPIVEEFIPEPPSPYSMEWLASLGYLYRTSVGKLTYIHTSENTPRKGGAV